MSGRLHGGGLAAWSIRRPIAVAMLALAIMVPGLLSLSQLTVDLLPDISYPNIRVRVLDPGVPAPVMEDQVTRHLEEQLAITEGAVDVQSYTRQGRSAVDLSFPYGTDLDAALRDASARLDRARRFLPDTIEPPVIYKTDPSQAPVLELVASSRGRDPRDLYTWVDYEFAKNFINLPGVASVEVGGGQAREIEVEVDQERLAAAGLSLESVKDLIDRENRNAGGGSAQLPGRELSTQVLGRFTSLSDLAGLPLQVGEGEQHHIVRLSDVARIRDGHGEEQLRIRLNGVPGVKISIQKQPEANTVAVVDAVLEHLEWMRAQRLIPQDVEIRRVNDQAVFIRHALRNAAYAAASGALLAMTVVYLFLGSLRRTLIVGTAIPLAIFVTFMLMQLFELSLNIMTLGGLALGIGILVDSTIVMLENIYRHQRQGQSGLDDAVAAAAEVNSPIVASTTTNLAAVLPFLFIGGLAGLLFRELIVTISAAIAASMIVALTLVPALAARVPAQPPGRMRRWTDRQLGRLQGAYAAGLRLVLRLPWVPLIVLLGGLGWAVSIMDQAEDAFLPPVDTGQVRIRIQGDPGMQLETMDRAVRDIEALLLEYPEVDTLFSQVGGFVYGRTQWFSGNRSTLRLQLVPPRRRALDTEAWVEQVRPRLDALRLPGFRIRIWAKNKVQGIRLGRGDDDLSLRVAGPDLETLAEIGQGITERLEGLPGLSNLSHTYGEVSEELAVTVDRLRAADLEISPEDISQALKVALDGVVVTDMIDGDRRYEVRLRLPRERVRSLDDMEDIIVALRGQAPIRLLDVARVSMRPAPATIFRDRQIRADEIRSTLDEGQSLEEVMGRIQARLSDLELPVGYSLYDDGAVRTLRAGRRLGNLLLLLAIFLVFVVMAVQYESLRNPLVILFSIPFTLIGVAGGLWYNGLSLSMPVWLGMIMLAGIVVNNAIVLVEQIEIERAAGSPMDEAILRAGRLRLRPILMTTLTTVVGMSPLALKIGEGSEMLQPLAVVMVWGLSFSTLVSLILVPAVYRMTHRRHRPQAAAQGAPP